MTAVQRPARVGVHPPAWHDGVPRLLAALECALPVRFEPRGPGEWEGLDALVCVGADARAEGEAAAAAGVRSLVLLHDEAQAPGPIEEVATSGAVALDRRLRARTLPDAHLGPVAPLAAPEGEVIAARDGGALWVRAGRLDLAAAAPLELSEHESLRDRLQKGRSAALLALVHLLRELTADRRWQPPPARAVLLLDDPNLHWPTYGFLHLPELVRDAEAHGYHLSLATIPLDWWFAHPRALALLRGHPGALSLVFHGNNHTGRELGQPASETEGVALAAQALRRARAFERRSGAAVQRVMVPPHEACSESTVRGLLLCGFEAITMTRPFPWLSAAGDPWLLHPPVAGPLTGWERADFVAGGFPVMLRHPIVGRGPSELALRAFLDQPLILYGHHGDLADGLELFRDVVAEVDALTAPRWCSLEEIARVGYETRREGDLLRVRMLSRRAYVEVPEGVETIAVELPAAHGAPERERLMVAGEAAGDLADGCAPVPVPAGTTVALSLRHVDAVDPHHVPQPRLRAATLARRVVGEGRDRALPLLGRARAVRR
jgi:hypothetical protein